MSKHDLHAIHEQAVADGMVKVCIPMSDDDGFEWCFAHRISAAHARIDNVPVFCDAVNYGDVIEFREQDPPDVLFKEFLRVKTQGSHTLAFSFAPRKVLRTITPDDLQARGKRMREYLNAAPDSIKPLAVEGIGDGWMAGAWPMTASARDVRRYIRGFSG